MNEEERLREVRRIVDNETKIANCSIITKKNMKWKRRITKKKR